MQRSLLWKSLIVSGLSLVLLIPLMMIEGQISGRSQRQGEVIKDISESSAGRQHVVGPLLLLTYTERISYDVHSEKTGETHKEYRDVEDHRIIAPKDLGISGRIDVQERHRGLYKAQVFDLNATFKGTFHVPANFGLDVAQRKITPGRAYLLMGVSDLRGFRVPPQINWNGQSLGFQHGGIRRVLEQGIHSELGNIPFGTASEFTFELPVQLMGSQDLSIAPVGENTHGSLASNWRAPSFHGRFLPAQRQVGDQGFQATWQVSHLARNLGRILEQQADESFGVAFIDPVNIYLMSERAVKYGFLFVGLTFAAFFFFEMLKRLPIHPVQYFLVGVALALFFLLLISLSEHIPFLWAYVCAGGSCILLLGAYLIHVLKSSFRGASFAGGLAMLYGALYLLLLSEDYALVIGSGLLFTLLAAVMLGTRKLDWYKLTAERPQAVPPPVPTGI